MMFNKWNQADFHMQFTKSFELKSQSNIAPGFLTLLAVDISIESILILFMVMGFLRYELFYIHTHTPTVFNDSVSILSLG